MLAAIKKNEQHNRIMTPDFLYHYTSIESLAMILSTRKIRFNSLTELDDLTERDCHDFKSIGKYFFISSWTNIQEESLPFWNMYTPKMKGIRIKMPLDLFNDYLITTNGVKGVKSNFFKSIVPQNETFKDSFWILPTSEKYLFEVEYTDESDKLNPNIYSENGEKFIISLNKIGLFKSKHWTFQSEWRFIIKIFPFIQAQETNENYDLLIDSIKSIRNGRDLPFTDYFVNINEFKFKEMEILLGPKHSDADRIIVESLISKYNPTAKLLISDLHKKIK